MTPIFPSIQPRAGHLFIAALAEPDQADAVVAMESSREGMEQSHNAAYMRERPNYRGWIVAIGEGVHGLNWGDEVALKPWGGTWWPNPFRSFDGTYVNEGIYPNPHHGAGIAMPNEHLLLVCKPSMIIYRHPEEPVFKRLFVKYDDREAGLIDEKTGILLGGYDVSEVFERDGFSKINRIAKPNALAQVLKAGFDVYHDDFRVGDWVLCAPNAGTMIYKTDGEYGMIESADVPINLGSEKPVDRIEWKHYREAIYA